MNNLVNLMKQVFITILLIEPIAQARNFASSADLEMLLDTEEKVIKCLKNYVNAEAKKLDFLEKYLNRSKLEYETAIKDIPYYFGNPINAYTIVKRLGPDLEFAEKVLRNKTVIQTPNATFPTEEDLDNAVAGLLDIISTYKLNISDVANGILNASVSQSKEVYTEIVSPMTADDCFIIGLHLYSFELYKDAVVWLNEAYKKFDLNKDHYPVPIAELINSISQAYHHLEDYKNFIVWSEKLIKLRPDDPQSEERAMYLHQLRAKGPEKRSKRMTKIPSIKNNSTAEGISDICMGKTNITFNASKRTCHYAYGPHPFLKLARLKAEILHIDPDLVMYHQVLSEDEMQFLIDYATPMMWKSVDSDRQDFRNVERVKLKDNSSDIIAGVSKRAFYISETSPKDCEDLMVISYGIGGVYNPHWDVILHETRKSSYVRVGTILFYLSEVEQGGATVFPYLGLTIFPVKGAALVWKNHLPSGDGDVRLKHAACPMMRGAKWIAVKWPHQTINRQCPYWATEKGVVTEKIYKEILKHHQDLYAE